MTRSINVERAKDRIRQQRRRDKMAQAKAPTTHTINRAIVEALMQCVDINRQSGVHRMLTPMTLNEVLPRAIALLTLDTGGGVSLYDVEQVTQVVRNRVSKRVSRWLSDQATVRMARDDITPSN